jgi:hypothetical protein
MPYKLIKGKNDLLSQRPDIAKEADGWDPEKYAVSSCKRMAWICSRGHQWSTRIDHRSRYSTKCPYCQGQLVIKGENDLATKFPLIAAEAHGWNPSEFKYGSGKEKKQWLCPNGHIYVTTINQRTNSQRGCPQCSEWTYRFSRNGWVYLIRNNNEQKIGISNVPRDRLCRHRLNGWELIELKGPMGGEEAWDIEWAVKLWLKSNDLLASGKKEIWKTDSMVVASLFDLGQRASLDESQLKLLC